MSCTNVIRTVSKLPLIVVLGATGTGKSKLAIELASKYNGEIISADSMQVYKGLDIITNKVTTEERDQVPHHLLDIVSPLSRFTVVDFRNAALPLIESLQKKGKVPVIVGGTNYYIESLLWKVLINEETSSKELVYEKDRKVHQTDLKEPKIGKDLTVIKSQDHIDSNQNNDILLKPSEHLYSSESTISTEELYKTLERVDPDMAAVYHPNERRKILRSLQVWEQTKQCHSQHLKKQKQQLGGNSLGGPLRFPGTIIFWIDCDQEVLNPRLDGRVDNMIGMGLLKELQNFHDEYNKQYLLKNISDGTTELESLDNKCKSSIKPSHYTTGIFQSIGFKEFHRFLISPIEDRDSHKIQDLYKDGIERLKQATRKYSKNQIKWIKYRYLLTINRECPDIYRLNGTDVDKWIDNVRIPSQNIIDSILAEEEPSIKPYKLNRELAEYTSLRRVDKTQYKCEICNKILVGETQRQAHFYGKKHKKNADGIKLSRKRENSNEDSIEPDSKHSKIL